MITAYSDLVFNTNLFDERQRDLSKTGVKKVVDLIEQKQFLAANSVRHKFWVCPVKLECDAQKLLEFYVNIIYFLDVEFLFINWPVLMVKVSL